MRYEDWTFREAEVRLGEHRELRQALGLVSVPDRAAKERFVPFEARMKLTADGVRICMASRLKAPPFARAIRTTEVPPDSLMY